MIRKQLYIDEELEYALKSLAARTGRPEAEHVRNALRSYLGAERDATDDPMARMVGLVEAAAGPTDVAENHDDYLYGRSTGSRKRTRRPAKR